MDNGHTKREWPRNLSFHNLEGNLGTNVFHVCSKQREDIQRLVLYAGESVDRFDLPVARTGFRSEPGYDIYVLFKDPPEPGNYYRLNAKSSTLIPADSIDGRRYDFIRISWQTGMKWQKESGRWTGAARRYITLELLSIDKASYDYFSTLRISLIGPKSHIFVPC